MSYLTVLRRLRSRHRPLPRKILLRLFVVAAILIGFPAPAHAAPTVQLWTLSSADRVFSTSQRPLGAPASITLYSARGEQEAAQIAVRSSSAEALTSVRVTASGLAGPDGARIPESNIVVRRAYDHPQIKVMGGDVELPPNDGKSYYDALLDDVSYDLLKHTLDVPSGITQPYHYSVTVPAGQAPGVYTGSVAVSTSNAGTVTVSVRLAVYDVTLPASNQSTFKMNNWFTSAGWDYRGTVRAIPEQYDVKMYDADWWTVIENIAANHARHRNNVIYADFQALLIPNTKVGTAGLLQFDWTTFDRFIDTFDDAGAMQYIYTPTLLEKTADGKADVEILRGVNGVVERHLATPNTAATNIYFDMLFPALKAHLDEKGWTDRFYLSALDEPDTPDQVAAANWLYGKYRRYFPNPRTNEAHYTVLPGLDQNLTAVTPVLGHYEQHMGYYQDRRVNGTELWLYNCIQPEGAQMNRFISYHLAKTRLTPWLTWQVGGTGYLHWGWNFWFDNPGNPGEAPDTFNGLQTGDNWLVRPNKREFNVHDSLRSETQLDGVEDYELLAMLARTKPLTARAIANSLITDAVRYTRTGSDVDARHKMLLDELTGGAPDERFPFADGFEAGDGNWVRGRGTWSVTASGEYIQTDTSIWGSTSTPKSRAYGNVSASADLKIDSVNPDGGNTNWAGLMIRSSNATDMETGYLVGLRNNGEVFVYRSTRELGKAAAAGYRPGVYNRLRVIAAGNKLTVYVSDQPDPVLTVTDDAYPAGQVALVTGGAGARFDNITLNPDNNLAEAGPVTVSSTYSADGWHPAAAVDGRRSSTAGSMGWTSAGGPTADRTESITVDLGEPRSLGRVDLLPRADGANTGIGFPVDFTVQVSTDGTSWNTVASQTGYPRPGAAAQAFPFPAQLGRYIKVTGTKLSSDQFGAYHMQLAEIEAYGGNLAAGRPVSASSSYEAPAEGWQRANLTDGSHLSTVWNTMGWSSAAGAQNRTEWVGVDLGGPSRISRVELYARSDGPDTGAGFPVDFSIQVSDDGTTWTTVASAAGYGRPDHTAQVFTFPVTTARHVRVVGTALRTDPRGEARMQLAELRVG